MAKFIPLYARGGWHLPEAPEGTHVDDAIVDDEDYDRLVRYRWYANLGYAECKGEDAKELRSFAGAMHRVVVNAMSGVVVHHRNHDPRDNRKANLAVLSPEEHHRIHGDERRARLRFNVVTGPVQNGPDGWGVYARDRRLLSCHKERLAATAELERLRALTGEWWPNPLPAPIPPPSDSVNPMA